jgi:hypothetical protein
MPSDPPSPVPPALAPLDPGLPPVTPPSGRVIARLFLVPALLVGAVVGVLLLLTWLFGQAHTPEWFLKKLDDPNPEVRWRAASDLAQVLLRKDELASDVPFAFQLSDRLERARERSASAEKAFAEHSAGLSARELAPELAKIEPERNYILFLTACLGNLVIPVGAPQLADMAAPQLAGPGANKNQPQPAEMALEPEARRERQRRALWALATLGENLKRFDTKLSDEARDGVERQLESAVESGNHRELAKKVLNHLRRRRQGQPDAMGVSQALVACAGDEDPSVRYHAAFAMTFWAGGPAEEAGMEKALVQLANDDGRGVDELEERLKANPNSEAVQSRIRPKGFHVRPQAALALARRGSPQAPLDLLAELLDEKRLREIFVLENLKTRTRAPDEGLVALTIGDTLKALVQLRQKRPGDPRLPERFGPLVEELARHPNPAIRAEAERARAALKGGE